MAEISSLCSPHFKCLLQYCIGHLILQYLLWLYRVGHMWYFYCFLPEIILGSRHAFSQCLCKHTVDVEYQYNCFHSLLQKSYHFFPSDSFNLNNLSNYPVNTVMLLVHFLLAVPGWGVSTVVRWALIAQDQYGMNWLEEAFSSLCVGAVWCRKSIKWSNYIWALEREAASPVHVSGYLQLLGQWSSLQLGLTQPSLKPKWVQQHTIKKSQC